MALIINGERIDGAILEQEFGQIKGYFERLGNVSCCERDDEFRGYARQNILSRVLLAQQADREIDDPPGEEIDAALAKIIEEHGGKEQFMLAVGATPGDFDAIRAELAQNLKLERLIDRVCSPWPEPDDEALRAAHRAHRDQFMTDERIRAMHILKAPSKSEERAGAYAALREVRRRALAGEDFYTLAREHSDKPEHEIDLGYFKRGELMEEFEIVAFSLRVGEVSPVFASPYGFHIARITERIPSVPMPFDAVRDDVRALLRAEHRDAKLQAYVAELEKQATIEEVDDEEDVDAGVTVRF